MSSICKKPHRWKTVRFLLEQDVKNQFRIFGKIFLNPKLKSLLKSI